MKQKHTHLFHYLIVLCIGITTSLLLSGCNSCTTNPGSGSDIGENPVDGITFQINESAVLAKVSFEDEAEADICHQTAYLDFKDPDWYDKFMEEHQTLYPNYLDPLVSGVYVQPDPSSGDGAISCNLQLPPDLDIDISNLGLISKEKTPILRVTSTDSEETVSSSFSYFCPSKQKTLHLVYNLVCLSNAERLISKPGCQAQDSYASTYEALLDHYSCSIPAFNEDIDFDLEVPEFIKEVSTSEHCNQISGDTGECFTLFHNIDEDNIYTTVIRINDNNCVLRLSYNDPEILKFIRISRSGSTSI
ncbi:MAG: hypothetical protein AAF696_12235 [Bacteroidota bacterium]